MSAPSSYLPLWISCSISAFSALSSLFIYFLLLFLSSPPTCTLSSSWSLNNPWCCFTPDEQQKNICLVLTVPNINFMENKADCRAAQITREEREDPALGSLQHHRKTLLLDYWFTAQNGWNISSVKLINPSLASFMKMDLLSVIILMDCYDRTS